MKFNNILEREFWEKVYIAAIRTGANYINASLAADDALMALRERNSP